MYISVIHSLGHVSCSDKNSLATKLYVISYLNYFIFSYLFFCPAPGSPTSFKTIVQDPADRLHGPRIKLTWQIPAEPNGLIRSYTVFYTYNGNTKRETFGEDVLSYTVDVLGGLTYEFNVRAVTIKPGENATSAVNVPEYSKSSLHFRELVKTTILEQDPPLG